MYLIVGGKGYLGTNLIEAILRKTSEKICATARTIPEFSNDPRIIWEVCDIKDYESIDGLTGKLCGEPLKVVVCAAAHHPDAVQKDPRAAWNTNITALSYLINRLENVERLYYPSTDSVYGESENGYHFKEGDATNPVNLYGRQKSVAEQVIIGYGYNVVRYPFLIGPSLIKNKPHFYDKIVDTISKGDSIDMFLDSYRSSLDFRSAASYMIDLMESRGDVPSIINICGDQDLSKYDVGLTIARKLGVPEKRIVPVSISHDTDIFEAPRSRSTLMDNTKLKSLLNLDKITLQL